MSTLKCRPGRWPIWIVVAAALFSAQDARSGQPPDGLLLAQGTIETLTGTLIIELDARYLTNSRYWLHIVEMVITGQELHSSGSARILARGGPVAENSQEIIQISRRLEPGLYFIYIFASRTAYSSPNLSKSRGGESAIIEAGRKMVRKLPYSSLEHHIGFPVLYLPFNCYLPDRDCCAWGGTTKACDYNAIFGSLRERIDKAVESCSRHTSWLADLQKSPPMTSFVLVNTESFPFMRSIAKLVEFDAGLTRIVGKALIKECWDWFPRPKDYQGKQLMTEMPQNMAKQWIDLSRQIEAEEQRLDRMVDDVATNLQRNDR